MTFPRCSLILLLLLAVSTDALRAKEEDSKGGPAEFKKLKYRSIGPAIGGRVSRSAGVPGDPLVYYAGAASGGVWKTMDGGLTWKPIFDDQPASSIGSLAVSASDPNIIYVGTGEANIRGNVAAGNGIYKSTDAGKTWTHVWKQEGQIGTMIVHPANPDIAFAAVLGHAFGPNPERGVYRTTNGGKDWQRVLFKDADAGASDVCFDPSNPHVLFAGLWQARRRPWEMTSGGPGSGLYMSRDGGTTWKQLKETGLPEGTWGKIGLAVAASDGRRVYALIEAAQGGLYRSDDGGDNWSLVNAGRYLRQRPWYFSTVHVDPKNPDVVWCPSVRLLKSMDGGKTFAQVKGPHHVDHHDLWIDPANPKRMIDSNDGGVDITLNGGESWYAPPLPIAQFYHIAVDKRTPYHVSGPVQDMGTASGPSNSLCSSGIALGDWHGVGGGETGFTAPDPSNPNVVYAGEYGGYISRYDHQTRCACNISIYPINASGHAAADLRYRFQWTAPILISPHDPKVIYHAGNVLMRTTDGGKHWSALSPDLTRNDKSKQQWSGGPITGDNTGAEYYCTIFALAESPVEKGVLWAGTDDGLVHVSRDGGKNWTNVTRNIPGMPDWGTVAAVEPSHKDAGTAYLVVDAHRLDDMHPYLYQTTDFGKTWKSLAARLPQDVYLHAVREDPKRPGLLFLGTERGVSYSTDAGDHWQELKLNLPTVAVHDLVVKDNDLVVGTSGRSIWIFDDLTPIRELTPKVAEEEVRLFPPAPAVRWRYHGPIYSQGDKSAGANPPAGALIHYYLKKKPKDSIALEVFDEAGNLVRRLGKEEFDDTPVGHPDGPDEEPKKIELGTEPGVHRVVWNLAYDGAALVKKAKNDGGNPASGPLVKPGTYTVKLTVDKKEQTAQVTVLPDPRCGPEMAGFDEQLAFALAIRDDLNRLAQLVNRIRLVRAQLAGQRELIKDRDGAEPLRAAAQELIDRLDAVEAKLHNPKAEVSYDILAQRGGAQLYSQIAALYEWAKGSDAAPTQGMREVHDEQHRSLQERQAELDKLIAEGLARYNEAARKREVPNIVVPVQ